MVFKALLLVVYKKEGMPTVKDVYQVVDCKVNPLRVTQMCDDFIDVVFKHDISQVKDNENNVVMICRSDHSNNYVMFATPSDHVVFFPSISDAKPLHRHLGHIDLSYLDLKRYCV